MSRSTKFRGQREDTKEWAIGYLIEWKVVYGKEHKELKHVSVVMSNGELDIGMVEVIPETVGQFTGRTDDGGDELYDGDIISFDYELHGYEGVIEWSEALSAFVVKRKDKDPLFLYDIDDAVTKLGNVYDID